MPAGRPTKYGQEILDKTRKYIDGGYGIFPSIAGLALALKVSRDTVREWAKEEGKEEFSAIIEELQALQEQKLLENGLTNEYNPTITKVVLTKHGYSDKQETALTGANGKDLNPSLNEDDRELLKRFVAQTSEK